MFQAYLTNTTHMHTHTHTHVPIHIPTHIVSHSHIPAPCLLLPCTRSLFPFSFVPLSPTHPPTHPHPPTRPQASAPVAMTNVVNTVLTQLHRVVYFAQELATQNSTEGQAAVYPVLTVRARGREGGREGGFVGERDGL